jgi:uncharacterized membrane protein
MPFLSKLMIALFVLAAVLWIGGPASFWTAAVPVAEGRSPLRCVRGWCGAYFAALRAVGVRLRDFNRAT